MLPPRVTARKFKRKASLSFQADFVDIDGQRKRNKIAHNKSDADLKKTEIQKNLLRKMQVYTFMPQ